MKKLITFILILFSLNAMAQVGVGLDGSVIISVKPAETTLSNNDTILVSKVDGIVRGIALIDFINLLPSGGGTGTDGINCWDINGNGVNDPSEDVNSDGEFNALDCQGVAGADGATGAQGPQGAQGPAGADGLDGADGTNGLSAYQIWLNEGNSGTETDFLNSLQGAEGPQGPQGPSGPGSGDMLASVYDTDGNGVVDTVDNGAVGPEGPAGSDGADGLSAYQIWLNDGNSGTETDFLNSLQGADGADGAVGPQGPQGIQGPPGADGADGTNGTNGSDGADGLSAYQIWLNEGNSGTETDFLNSLQGADGTDGAVGPQGPQGIQGPPGADGADGAVGPQGPPGADGIGSGIVAEGVYTAPGGSTFYTINHGLGYAPSVSRIHITNEDGWNATTPEVGNITASSFDVITSNTNASGNLGWVIFGADATTPIVGSEIVSAIDTELGQTTWKTGGGTAEGGIVAEGVITTTGGGNITYTINHNLGYAPNNTRIQVQKVGTNSSSSYNIVDNITSTTFDLTSNAVSGENYAWRIYGADATTPIVGSEIVSAIDTELGQTTWKTGGGTAEGGIVAEGVFNTTSGSGLYTVNHGLGYAPSLSRIQIQEVNSPTGVARYAASIENVTSNSFDVRAATNTNFSYAWRIYGADATTPISGSEIVSAIDTELGQTTWKTGGGSGNFFNRKIYRNVTTDEDGTAPTIVDDGGEDKISVGLISGSDNVTVLLDGQHEVGFIYGYRLTSDNASISVRPSSGTYQVYIEGDNSGGTQFNKDGKGTVFIERLDATNYFITGVGTVSVADVTPPTITGVQVLDSAPDELLVSFSEDVGYGGITNVSFDVDFSDITMTGLAGINGNQIRYGLSRDVVNGEVGNVTFGNGFIVQDLAGNNMVTPVTAQVSNGVAAVAPSSLYAENSAINGGSGTGSWYANGATLTTVSDNDFTTGTAFQIEPNGDRFNSIRLDLDNASVSTWSGGQLSQLVPGETYTITFNYKSDGTADVRPYFNFRDADGNTEDYFDTDPTTSIQSFSRTFTVSANGTNTGASERIEITPDISTPPEGYIRVGDFQITVGSANLYAENSAGNGGSGVGSWQGRSGGSVTTINDSDFTGGTALEIENGGGQFAGASLPLDDANVAVWSGGQITTLDPNDVYTITFNAKEELASGQTGYFSVSMNNANVTEGNILADDTSVTSNSFNFTIPSGGQTSGQSYEIRIASNYATSPYNGKLFIGDITIEKTTDN